MQPSSPIGVFDSGVGGLTVLREIRSALPGEHLLYVADSQHVPYSENPGSSSRPQHRKLSTVVAPL